MTPRRIGPDDPALTDILTLIRTSFAFMDGRIDPPSSMHRLTLETMSDQATTGEVWAVGEPVEACVVLTPRPDSLYLGKLAVAAQARGQGLARTLIQLAETRAIARHLPCVELQSRIELIENHATFIALGFQEVGRTAHPGYDRATSITFRKPVSA